MGAPLPQGVDVITGGGGRVRDWHSVNFGTRRRKEEEPEELAAEAVIFTPAPVDPLDKITTKPRIKAWRQKQQQDEDEAIARIVAELM